MYITGATRNPEAEVSRNNGRDNKLPDRQSRQRYKCQEQEDKMVLLVVDTQKAITRTDLYNFSVFENNVKKLISAARENGVEVIYIRHDDGAGAELTKGTVGFEIYEGFKPEPGEAIFDKTVNSPFKGTGLLEYLQGKKEQTVIVAGLQTDYCIDATVKCGFEHGFHMIVAAGANSTFDNAYMSAEASCRYYNDFMWKVRYAECISLEETIGRMREAMPVYDKITGILFRWGLEEKEVQQISETAWQVGDDAILKVYRDVEMLERNLKILHILTEMDIPVGEIVLTKDRERYVKCDGLYCFLSKRLPGKAIGQIRDAEKAAMKMGEIIADLHIAFRKCESEDTFCTNSLLDEMNGWVRDNLEKNHWHYIERDAYDETVSRLGSVYGQLPVQLIHRDVHFGNFLFDNGEFCGYIDFDLSQRNIRIFDLCYFLLGLLSEEEKLKIGEEQWFAMVQNVFAGYGGKIELSAAEKQAVPCVMECIELLFTAWFEESKDARCAQDAFKIYEFVKRQEDRLGRLLAR